MTNTVEISCPKCQQGMQVQLEQAGPAVLCGKCQHEFPLKVALACPECRRPLQVRKEYLGRRIACSYCKHTFKAALDTQPNLVPSNATVAASGSGDAAGPETKFKGLQEEVERLREQLLSSNSERTAAMLSLQQTRGLVQHLQNQVQALQQLRNPEREASCEQELAGLRTECGHLRGQLQVAQAELARLEKEREVTRMSPVVPLASKVDSSELDQLRAERNQLVGEVEHLRVELASRLADCEALLQTKGEAAALREERDAAHARVQALEGERDVARSRVQTLEEEQEAARSRMQSLESELDQECNANKAARERSARSVQELEDALADAKAVLAKQVAIQEQERQTLQADREQLQARCDAQVQELEQLRARGGELEQTLAQAAAGHQSFRNEWERELGESRACLEAERQSFAGQLEQFCGRACELEQELSQARAGAAAEAGRLLSEVEALRGECEQSREREQRLNGEIEWLRAQVLDLQQLPTSPEGHLVLSADALTRAVEEARGQWGQGQGANRGLRDGQEIERRARTDGELVDAERQRLSQELETAQRQAAEELAQFQQQLDRLQEQVAAAHGERDAAEAKLAATAETERGAAALQREFDQFKERLAAVAEERDRLAVEYADARADIAELEARLQPDAAAGVPPGQGKVEEVAPVPLSDRFLELAEEVQALQAQVESTGPGSRVVRHPTDKRAGLWGKLFGSNKSGRTEGESPLARKLDTLRNEALAERDKHLLAEAESVRRELEQRLEEAHAQLQEAKARADRLDRELIETPSSGSRYSSLGTRQDGAHSAPYAPTAGNSGNSPSTPWRLDEHT